MEKLPILELLQDSCDPPLRPESLERLQEAMHVRFHEDYAAFLLQFNGGFFRGIVEFTVPDTARDFSSRPSIDCFYGHPDDGIDDAGLLWWKETLEDCVSDDFVAIGRCNRDQVL